MYCVLLGPPGSGKGTQSEFLVEALGLIHVATGDMFREHLRHQSELGRKAQSYIDEGNLVPDEITIAMLLERIDATQGGSTIFDGFPRTIDQARALDIALTDRGQKGDHVLLLEGSSEELVLRLGGRLTCPADGTIYHETKSPPEIPGHCDQCSNLLMQRSDDEPKAITNRIQVYNEQTAPVAEYYEQTGMLVRIDGSQPPNQVRGELLKVLKESRSNGDT